jgi:Tfp pilus assembly protein PilN
MTGAEELGIAGGIISMLLGVVLALVAYVFTSKTTALEKIIATLQEQNREQAIQIASIEQAASLERVVQTLERTQSGQSETMRVLDRLAIVVERLDRKLGMSGGEYPAVRKQST